ncbi:type II toxin-antitoxin system PemK/MazF family toxin [Levilactobacillus andaensis]|uniref:type II toxin-antitoxin system PemK/MazF family toxin n=1 Tax=Levilactobacillus andaensis TaxID=2799570 RepID=UPI0019420766|nr:type II toxin-antitoxin system PemK/MazF family toxin [Levilactobacillus andaensis]
MFTYDFHGYTPHQGDLIFVTFDPSVGREIQKRRPAIVISSTVFNQRTGYVTVCPITSKIRTQAGYVDLHANQIKGQINAIQFRTIDFIAKDHAIQFVEKANAVDFMRVAKIVNDGLGFDRVIGNI